MNFIRLILSFLLLTSPAAAYAGASDGGNDGPNGGDDVGLEFVQVSRDALRDIRRMTVEFKDLQSLALERKLETTKILVVDKPLYAVRGKIRQESVALNHPKKNTIWLYRGRWQKIQHEIVRRAIALHELFGLLGLESTGEYPISSKYLQVYGILNCESDLCINTAGSSTGKLSFENAIASIPNSASDPKDCDAIRGTSFSIFTDRMSQGAVRELMRRLDVLAQDYPQFYNATLKVLQKRMQWQYTHQGLGALYQSPDQSNPDSQLIRFSQSCKRGVVYIHEGLYSELDDRGKAAILMQALMSAKLGPALHPQAMHNLLLGLFAPKLEALERTRAALDDITPTILSGKYDVFVDFPRIEGKAFVQIGHSSGPSLLDTWWCEGWPVDGDRGFTDPIQDNTDHPTSRAFGVNWKLKAKWVTTYPRSRRAYHYWQAPHGDKNQDGQVIALPMYIGCSAVLPASDVVHHSYVSISHDSMQDYLFGRDSWISASRGFSPRDVFSYRIFINGVPQVDGVFGQVSGNGNTFFELDLW